MENITADLGSLIASNLHRFNEHRTQLWAYYSYSFDSRCVQINQNLPQWLPPLDLKAIIMSSLTLLLFCSLSLLSISFMTFGRKAKLARKFPSPRKYPIIGNLAHFAVPYEEIRDVISKMILKHGRRFVFWIFHEPYVVLVEANAVQKVLSSPKYVDKGSDYKHIKWLMGNGLITSDVDIWKEDRKLLSPTFKYQRFDGFVAIFNKYSHILVDVLDNLFQTQKDVNLHPVLCRATMDFINESALGQPSSFQYELDSHFLEAVHTALYIIRLRILKPWLRFPIIWYILGLGKKEVDAKKTLAKVISSAVLLRKKKLKKKSRGMREDSYGISSTDDEGSSPFIDSLLATKSDEDIVSHLITIFGAGFETTASGMNFTLFLLAHDAKCQAKVHQEIDKVFGEELDRDVTFADLSELKYLEMCIKESLRLFPPAPVFIRKPLEDIELDDELTIPAKTNICFFLHELHRDPSVFPNPELFEPNRFLPEKCISRHPYAYIPFSIGARNCLGFRYAMVQMKIALTHVLRRFTVATKQKREDLKVVFGIVLEPSPPIKLTLTSRRNIPIKK